MNIFIKVLSAISIFAILTSNSINTDALTFAKKDKGNFANRQQLAKDQSGSCGNTVEYKFTATTGELRILGVGEMYDYDENSYPWYSLRYYIKSAIIEDGVTHIGDNSFNFCTGMTSVDIPNSVVTIGNSAFKYTGLKDINLSENITKIGEYAFWGCDFTFITIPQSIKIISKGMFFYCEKLVSVTIPESITHIENSAFSQCKNLASINIPDSVTSIGSSAFSYCEELVSIAIPAGVKSIESSTFYSCKKLNSITIPDSVTDIGSSAFSLCTNLSSIVIPSSVKNINTAAFQVAGFTKIILPSGVETIGNYAFSDCPYLTSVTISDTVNSIGNAFYNSFNLEEIKVDSKNSHYKDIDGVLFSKDGNVLIRYPIGKEGNVYHIPSGVINIGDQAFYTCSQLKSITIPDSVTSINSEAFRSCTQLTSIIIPNSVTSIGDYAFYYCTNLEKINIPNSISFIGKASGMCSSLNLIEINNDYFVSQINSIFPNSPIKTIELGNEITNITQNSFIGYNSLTEINTAENNTKYTSIDGVLFSKNGSILIRYPEGKFGKYIIPKKVVSIGENAFKFCKNLDEIKMSSNVSCIEDNAFNECSNLSSFFFEGKNEPTYGNEVFANCTLLRYILVFGQYYKSTFCGLPIKKLIITKNFRANLLKYRKYLFLML